MGEAGLFLFVRDHETVIFPACWMDFPIFSPPLFLLAIFPPPIFSPLTPGCWLFFFFFFFCRGSVGELLSFLEENVFLPPAFFEFFLFVYLFIYVWEREQRSCVALIRLIAFLPRLLSFHAEGEKIGG